MHNFCITAVLFTNAIWALTFYRFNFVLSVDPATQRSNRQTVCDVISSAEPVSTQTAGHSNQHSFKRFKLSYHTVHIEIVRLHSRVVVSFTDCGFICRKTRRVLLLSACFPNVPIHFQPIKISVFLFCPHRFCRAAFPSGV